MSSRNPTWLNTPEVFQRRQKTLSETLDRRSIIKNSPTETPSITDVAWAAGIYEGEGHIAKDKKCHPSKGMRVVVTQKDTWLLYRLKALFGGVIYNRPQRNWSEWRLSSKTFVDAFLKAIYPYLSPRRKAQIDAIYPMSRLL